MELKISILYVVNALVCAWMWLCKCAMCTDIFNNNNVQEFVFYIYQISKIDISIKDGCLIIQSSNMNTFNLFVVWWDRQWRVKSKCKQLFSLKLCFTPPASTVVPSSGCYVGESSQYVNRKREMLESASAAAWTLGFLKLSVSASGQTESKRAIAEITALLTQQPTSVRSLL